MELEVFKAELEKKSAELKAEQAKNIAAALEGSAAAAAEYKANAEKLEAEIKGLSTKLDNIEMKQKQVIHKATGGNSFGNAFAELVSKSHDEIKEVGAGRAAKFRMEGIDMKSAGNMTAAANLTGESVVTYQNQPALVPSQKVNFRSLVPTINSSTGTYVIYRETGAAGQIGFRSAGVAKNQVDYDFTRIAYNANYLAGYVRIAKEMLQDLPFMQTALPQMLLRDFYKRENAQFYTDLSTSATGPSSATGSNFIEEIIDLVGKMEDTDFDVTGIVLKPSVVAAIQNTKPSNYNLPGAVSLSNLGQLTINGIPVFKASWMADARVLLGDWSQAKIVNVDGLKVEFFEQDSDNVQKNLVTVRIEAREVLAIDRQDAFTFATIANS